ncbi:MAG TPA: hypothetical protein PKG63_06055 [Bacteroidales bacterium]|jgi:hypothetical protein|nr:hypothetical protein [Bacteroidales bacterium]
MNKKQLGFIIAIFGFILIAANALLYVFNPIQAKPSILILGVLIYLTGMFLLKKGK